MCIYGNFCLIVWLSSESTFVVEENHLQLSASIKWFHSAQGVLVAVQNVLEVLSVAYKLGNGATASCLNYRGQVQQLLNRGHSLDAVVGVHEEFIMHLRKHDSFDVAGDSVLGKSLFQSKCADLPLLNAFQSQQSVRGSSWHSARGSSLTGERPLPRMAAMFAKGNTSHVTVQRERVAHGGRGMASTAVATSHPFQRGPHQQQGERVLHTFDGLTLMGST